MKRSPGPRLRATSFSHSTTSPWPMLRWAVSTMRRFISCIGLWMPGVSNSTICAPGRFTTARMRLRVVWGLSETMATFWPTRRFTRVDLPTFGPADHGHEARAEGRRRGGVAHAALRDRDPRGSARG